MQSAKSGVGRWVVGGGRGGGRWCSLRMPASGACLARCMCVYGGGQCDRSFTVHARCLPCTHGPHHA